MDETCEIQCAYNICQLENEIQRKVCEKGRRRFAARIVQRGLMYIGALNSFFGRHVVQFVVHWTAASWFESATVCIYMYVHTHTHIHTYHMYHPDVCINLDLFVIFYSVLVFVLYFGRMSFWRGFLARADRGYGGDMSLICGHGQPLKSFSEGNKK